MKKMSAAITLNGIKINSVELFREYFDFKEIYELLKKDGFLYRSFVESVFPPYIRIMLFGYNAADGSRRDETPMNLLSAPEKCQEYYPLYFNKAMGSNCVTINITSFSEYISKLYEWDSLDNDGLPRHGDWPGPEEFRNSTNRLLENISGDRRKTLSADSAVAVYIYLLLHIQAGLLPDESSSYEQLTYILEQNAPADTRIEKNIAIKEDTGRFVVGDYYEGGTAEPGKIELVRITNRSSSITAVSISHSILSREVAQGESVYVLRKAGRYLSFLPRCAVVGDTLLLIENGRLCTLWNGSTSYMDTDIQSPVCWAHSNEYGTFIIDENGCLDDVNAWPEAMPAQPVRSVSSYGVDYCMLLEDGSVDSRLPKTGWNHVLYVSLGLNSGIAIDSNRIPLLQDGSRLPFPDAVEAYVMEEHYICLNSNGQILTDSELSVDETVYAAAVCRKGYILAHKSRLLLISFQNTVLHEWPDIHTTELTASNDIVAYYDGNSSRIKQLAL